MKKLTLLLLILTAILAMPFAFFAQQSPGSARNGQDDPKIFSNSSPPIPNRDQGKGPSIPSSEPYSRGIRRLRMSRYSKFEKYMRVTEEQKKAAEPFLKNKNSGICRVWPSDYKLPKGVKAKLTDLDIQDINSMSKYYSFAEMLHVSGANDISVDGGVIRTSVSRNSFGAIVSLGEIDIDSVNLKTPEAARMMAVKFPEKLSELEGLQADHPSSIDAVVGRTYLVRSMVADYYDSLTVFKIVEKDAEGALLLYWKRLYRSTAPVFK